MSADKAITFTVDEYLVQLMSEACEVGHAASKCHQFGFHQEYEVGPGRYSVNSKALSAEIGDLLGVCDCLDLDWAVIATHRSLKRIKMARVKDEFLKRGTKNHDRQKDQTDEH